MAAKSAKQTSVHYAANGRFEPKVPDAALFAEVCYAEDESIRNEYRWSQSLKSIMERILGEKIQSTAELGIDGLHDRHGNEIIFFEVPETESPRKAFRKLTNATDPPNAKRGGASEYGCSVETPIGFVYHALTIHGDVGGWRKDIELGAAEFGFSLARIRKNKFVVDGNQEFEICNCTVKFF